MSRLIAAVTLSPNRMQVAVASLSHVSAPPQWRLCTEAVIARTVDPLLVLERLLAVVGEIDVILVHQPEAASMLLRRYGQQTVVVVQSPHPKSKVLWASSVPKAWAPLLMAHWRVADLIYLHTRRLRQAAALDDERAASTIVAAAAGTIFDQFRYAPSRHGTSGGDCASTATCPLRTRG
jgi:hypothetical protein